MKKALYVIIAILLAVIIFFMGVLINQKTNNSLIKRTEEVTKQATETSSSNSYITTEDHLAELSDTKKKSEEIEFVHITTPFVYGLYGYNGVVGYSSLHNNKIKLVTTNGGHGDDNFLSVNMIDLTDVNKIIFKVNSLSGTANSSASIRHIRLWGYISSTQYTISNYSIYSWTNTGATMATGWDKYVTICDLSSTVQNWTGEVTMDTSTLTGSYHIGLYGFNRPDSVTTPISFDIDVILE